MGGIQKKIVHLTTSHSRYDDRIFLKESCSLAKLYSTYLLVADGRGNELCQGVNIKDIGQPISRLHRLLVKPWVMLFQALSLKAKVYHFHDPELIPVGIILRLCNKIVIYDAHENLSATVAYKKGVPHQARCVVYFVIKYVEKISSYFFHNIICANVDIAQNFNVKKIVVIENFVLDKEIEQLPLNNTKKDARIICYVGGITKQRGILQLLTALQLCDAELWLAGPIESEGLFREMKSHVAWSKVKYFGIVNREMVYNIYSIAQCGVLTFLAHPNHTHCSPNKLYEYMGSGLPVIASNFPVWKKKVEEAGCGLCVDPANPKQIAEAIHTILSDMRGTKMMGKNGRSAVENSYKWSYACKLLFSCYKKYF